MMSGEDANLSGQPQALDEAKEPSGKASAVQAGAAWDKARLNGQGASSLHNPASACTLQDFSSQLLLFILTLPSWEYYSWRPCT